MCGISLLSTSANAHCWIANGLFDCSDPRAVSARLAQLAAAPFIPGERPRAGEGGTLGSPGILVPICTNRFAESVSLRFDIRAENKTFWIFVCYLSQYKYTITMLFVMYIIPTKLFSVPPIVFFSSGSERFNGWSLKVMKIYEPVIFHVLHLIQSTCIKIHIML